MSFRNYELMFIVRPDAGNDVARERAAHYQSMVEELGGSVDNLDEWGTRRLAYPIEDHVEGYYVIVEFAGDEKMTLEMDRRMKLDDTVIRHMLIRQEA